MNKPSRLSILALALAGLSCAAAAAERVAEPPGPAASAEVQAGLDEAALRLGERRGGESLSAAERARGEARRRGDAAGEGLAEVARAKALDAMLRTEEAAAAWVAAEEIWTRSGAIPERIVALCGRAALLLAAGRPAEATALVDEALRLAPGEERRPLATIEAINSGAERILARKGYAAAAPLLEAALRFGEKRAPGSLELARSLDNLGQVFAARGELPAAREAFERALAIREERAPGSLAVAESLTGLGVVALSQGGIAEAIDRYDRALAIRDRLEPGSLGVAANLTGLGNASYLQGDLDAAREYYLRGLAIRERQAPGSFSVASSLIGLGNVASVQGDLAAAVGHYRRAQEIQEKLAPGSLEVASSLGNLAMALRDQGDFAAARDAFLRALAIREKQAPGSIDVASTLMGLGNLIYMQGDLSAAEEYYLRALAILETRAPDSIPVAADLINLGNVASDRGHLVAAREHYLRSLEIRQRHAPDSPDVATSLNSLGSVCAVQGDLAAARDYFKRALAIQEQEVPDSRDHSMSLNNLGNVALLQGDLPAARDYLGRALAVVERQAPDSVDVAMNLHTLGLVASAAGDAAAARDYFHRALAIREREAPGSLDVAVSLDGLAELERSQGHLAAAEVSYRRAFAIRERLAPGALDFAASQDNLGRLALARGDAAEAERRFGQAWAIAREQRMAVVGDEARRGFAETFAQYATRLVHARLALGRVAEALRALEEVRAHGLLQILSERGLDSAVPDAALWSRFDLAEQAYVRAGKELADSGMEEQRLQDRIAVFERSGSPGAPTDHRERRALDAATRRREAAGEAYTRARVNRERLMVEVRRTVPGLEPQAFSLDGARRALPPRSVFLAWSLGAEQSAIFVIPADPARPVEAYTVPLGEERIRADVAALRERIGSAGRVRGIGGLPLAEAAGPAPETPLVAASRALYAALFPPAARPAIEAAERLILCPDGPLWDLPFAALVASADGAPTWLGLRKPLSYTPSLTLLALGRKTPAAPERTARAALVVGDPDFARATAPEAAAAPTERLRGERALLAGSEAAPERLPATADEALAVARLYGTEPLLGRAATEAAVRARISGASVVHLATHGWFHPSLAMSSGVLLAPAAAADGAAGAAAGEARPEDDGALQAWEFGRTLPLTADLVVLSACETGRGERVTGEGLVGLTRSIQAAGARSVVATLWKVADESTARLMVEFHGNLGRGMAKDEALRRAMASAAEAAGTGEPYFWAPFFLTGDAGR